MSTSPRSAVPWAVLVALSTCLGSCAGTSIQSPSAATIAQPSAAAPARPRSPEQAIAARVDSILEAEWKASGVSPSPQASDAQLFRRAHLDIIGALPAPEEVEAFLADTSPDKFERAVSALLASPRYAERWASYWEGALIRDKAKPRIVDRAAFRSWLRARFDENAPWDRVVRELVTASGKSSAGGDMKDRRIAAATSAAPAEQEGVNGAVNWFLQFDRSVEDVAGAAARSLLGVQIQCAQCHDHKTEKWTTSDFRHFAAAFARTRGRPVDDKERGMMRGFEVIDGEQPRLGRKATAEQRAIASLSPAALDGTALDGDAPRAELAAWMTAPENPWFAKAIVNRMWALFLGRGFVEPIDDLRPSNPPRAPAALDALAADFVAHRYDIKHLLQVLCSTRSYRLSAGSPEAEAAWAAFGPRALSAPVLLDAILSATGVDPLIEEAFGERADGLRAKMWENFRFLFDVDEAGASADFEGTIPQALQLLNGLVVGHGSRALRGATLAGVLAQPGGDVAAITSLYLRTLSRRPTAEETARWLRFIEDASPEADEPPAPTPSPNPLAKLDKKAPSVARSPRDRAYEDLFWALLNSSEFALQH